MKGRLIRAQMTRSKTISCEGKGVLGGDAYHPHLLSTVDWKSCKTGMGLPSTWTGERSIRSRLNVARRWTTALSCGRPLCQVARYPPSVYLRRRRRRWVSVSAQYLNGRPLCQVARYPPSVYLRRRRRRRRWVSGYSPQHLNGRPLCQVARYPPSVYLRRWRRRQSWVSG